MIFTEIKLKDAYLIKAEKLEDERGYFARIGCDEEFKAQGLKTNFVQSNVGYSLKKGTLRGLHFQRQPYQEVKLVRCSMGIIFDVIVDLRPDSPTYMQWFGTELRADDCYMLYVPKGFAQGYLTLTDNVEMYYHTTDFYAPEHAFGIRYNDPAFNIEWSEEINIISKQDTNWPDYVKQT